MDDRHQVMIKAHMAKKQRLEYEIMELLPYCILVFYTFPNQRPNPRYSLVKIENRNKTKRKCFRKL